MFHVYLLQSLKNKSLYVGYTSDSERRLKEHNGNESGYTKKYSPWELVYCEGYKSEKDARGREQKLKLHAQGLRRLKERLRESLTV
ncbi:MAG: GIY-YIG nuclease family protein [Patescibacteria group bacterium]|nr:GIY-YIG nuclease family protein [Patescibacteria group bacterium]